MTSLSTPRLVADLATAQRRLDDARNTNEQIEILMTIQQIKRELHARWVESQGVEV